MSDRVRRAMHEALDADGGNPSSVHGAGRSARARVETARVQVAKALVAAPREVVFASGGTEAVHLVVRGVGAASGVRAVFVDPCGHPALRAAAQRLGRECGIACESVPIRAGGGVLLDVLAERMNALRPALVAVSWVQHETGAVTNLRALADMVRATGGLLVLDAVQAFGRVPVDAGTTGAVALAVSAHKIGGPKGVGAAWIASGQRKLRRCSTVGRRSAG